MYNLKFAPILKGQREREKKEAGLSRLLDGGFINEGNILLRAVLVIHKMSRLPYPGSSARILKFDIKFCTGLSHICHPDSLNNSFLSQGCLWASSSKEAKRTHITRREF